MNPSGQKFEVEVHTIASVEENNDFLFSVLVEHIHEVEYFLESVVTFNVVVLK